MNKKLRQWIASPKETKTAWIVAAISIVVIATAFLWPDIGQITNQTATNQTTTHPASNTTHSETTEEESASIEKIIVAAQKQEKHTIKAETPKVEVATVKPSAQKSGIQSVIPEKPAPKTAVKPVIKKASPTPAKTATGAVSGYYVQLGAFKEHQRATALQKKVSTHWKTVLKKKSNNMIAVWVGPYANSKDAEAAKHSIAIRNKIKGFIVKN